MRNAGFHNSNSTEPCLEEDPHRGGEEDLIFEGVRPVCVRMRASQNIRAAFHVQGQASESRMMWREMSMSIRSRAISRESAYQAQKPPACGRKGSPMMIRYAGLKV